MANQAKAILLNDTENWYHWGCNLTSRALKKLISAHFDLAFCVPINQLHRIPQAPSSVREFNDPAFLHSFAADNASLIDILDQVDAVFINGEGSIHGAADLAMNLLYLALIAKLALNKAVYIVNHSAYPNDTTRPMGNDLDQLYTDVFQLVDYVAIREPLSLQLMQKLGAESVQQSFDCSVLELETSFAPRQEVISLGGSVSFDKGGLTQLLGSLNNYHRKGYEIRFLYGAPAFMAADDLALAELLHQQTECPVSTVCCTSAGQFAEHIRESAVMVSGRFHYSIIAHALGTPPVMLVSNTAKNSGLGKQIGIAAPLAWTDEHLASKSGELIEQALAIKNYPLTASAQLASLQASARKNLPPSCAEQETGAKATPAGPIRASTA